MKGADLSLSKGERSKIVFVLIAIVLLSVGYPFSEQGTAAAIVFVFLYLGLLGSGIYLVSANRFLLIFSILHTVVISISGLATILMDFGTPPWVRLTWGMSLIAYQSLIIAILVIFIIESKLVTIEVLFAAIAIYFMLAATFAMVYGAMEVVSPGSFISSSGAEMTWQRLAYFSYVTITTLGYGDIVPIAPAAQSVSAMEASIGTLYIAILIGRFVSLFQQGER
jgi:hypothetical protein